MEENAEITKQIEFLSDTNNAELSIAKNLQKTH